MAKKFFTFRWLSDGREHEAEVQFSHGWFVEKFVVSVNGVEVHSFSTIVFEGTKEEKILVGAFRLGVTKTTSFWSGVLKSVTLTVNGVSVGAYVPGLDLPQIGESGSSSPATAATPPASVPASTPVMGQQQSSSTVTYIDHRPFGTDRPVTLDGQSLVIESPGSPPSPIPLADIRKVHLLRDGELHKCMITDSSGSKRTILFKSRKPERARSYTVFLLALHEMLAKQQHPVEYQSGSQSMYMAGVVGLVLCLPIIIGLVFPILFLPGWVGILRSLSPSEYEPDQIPPKELPSFTG